MPKSNSGPFNAQPKVSVEANGWPSCAGQEAAEARPSVPVKWFRCAEMFVAQASAANSRGIGPNYSKLLHVTALQLLEAPAADGVYVPRQHLEDTSWSQKS